MPYSVAAKNAMLNADAAAWPPDALSLHSASPGATGANELAGGSPAYARQAAAWAAAANGAKALSGTPQFDVPSGATVAFIGLWHGATYLGYVDVTDEIFAAQGTYTVDAGTLDLNAVASA